MKRMLYFSVFLIVLCSFAFVATAKAVGSGGFENQVLSAKALGMGNVFVAQADDPAAVYFNPAGLTQLDGIQLSLGTALLLPSFDYTSPLGVKDSADSETFVVPNFYASWKINESWSAGLGYYMNFGLATHWKDTSGVRYLATDSEMTLYTLAPCAAYKVSDKLSLGLGIEYNMLTDITLQKMVYTGSSPEGKSELSGDGDGIGGYLGIMYEIYENHTAGLTYRTSSKIDIDGDVKITNLAGLYTIPVPSGYGFPVNYSTTAQTDITLPPRLLLGYAWQCTEKVVVELDYEWTGWSTYNEIDIKYAETDLTRSAVLNTGNPEKKNWQDVSSVGLGTQYSLNDEWDIRCGWFYFESPVTQEYLNPSIPDSSKNGIALGAGYKIKDVVIDLAYSLLVSSDRDVVNNIAPGKYQAQTNMAALNVTYKFK
ncbi:MAG: OmpP1/FadL family transporter [bacterium]